MQIRERGLPSNGRVFSSGTDYDAYLGERGVVSQDGGRAKGIIYGDGSAEVVIDQSYYRSGGISPDELPAIVLHELTELKSEGPDSHLKATIGEYGYILDRFGVDGLRRYHAKLCNLMGGINDIRNEALRILIGSR